MLVLARRIGESIIIGDNVVVTVVDIGPGRCRLGIECEKDIPVHREEVFNTIMRERMKNDKRSPESEKRSRDEA